MRFSTKTFLAVLFAALLSSQSANALLKGAPSGGASSNPNVSNATGVLPIANGGTGQTIAPLALQALSSGIFIDPRGYGAKCTGNYGASMTPGNVTVFHAGTGFQVGDTFIVQDQTLEGHMRGGQNATGHVTSVNGSGGITGIAMDTPGSGYFASAIWITPTSGVGNAGAVNVTATNNPPAAPSTTLASGGNATAATGGSTQSGGAYAVGDVFAIPNTLQDGNYMTGRVSAVSAGLVTAYTINNPGGGYAITSAAPTIAVTGIGNGLTINITSSTAEPANTWDDTFGLATGTVIAAAEGGAELLPDNCWGANVMPKGGTAMVGQSWAANYGYSDDPSLYTPSPGTHLFIIGTPAFGIDLNRAGNFAMVGFEVRGYTGANFGGSTTWDSTACIGTKFGAGGAAGAGVPANVYTYQMSAKSCVTGFGSNDGTGSLIYAKDENSDWGANQNGVWGPVSDYVSINASIPSANTGFWLTGSSGGLSTFIRPRVEYAGTAFRFDNFGSLQAELDNVQVDRVGLCAVMATNTQQIKITGGIIKGAGLSGTLVVTGAANNGSGLIRLTVSGFGNNTTGGGTATSGLVTGDKINVSGVVGTTEANANQWTLTVIDGTHIDLQGSTFTNAYVSGGFGNVNGKGSYICLNNVTDFHSDNVGYYGYSAGTNVSPASVIDSTGSTNISMTNGAANLGNGNSGGYRQAFANWHNSGNTAPANTVIDVMGSPPFRNDNTVISYGATGNVGIGTSSPNANVVLDLSASTSGILMPQGTTAQRPTAVLGEWRLNLTTSAPEFYDQSQWNILPSTTTVAPAPGYNLQSTTTGGEGAQWVAATSGVTWPTNGSVVVSNTTNSPTGIAEVDGQCIVGAAGAWGAGACAGSTGVNLGSTVTGTSPQRSGDATTGFYTAGAAEVDVAISGAQVAKWTAAGSSALAYIPSGSTIPTDGLYLPASNTSAIADRTLPVVKFTNPASAVNFLTLSGSATGVASTISVGGTDTNGTGMGIAVNALNATATGVGGAVVLTAGNGFGTGAGGAITFTTGAGATAGGSGGVLTFNTGAGGSSSTAAGAAINFNAGAPGQSGNPAGGAINLTGGLNSTGGNGGAVNVTGGNGTGGGFAGGAVVITGGSGGGAVTSGGAVTIAGGVGIGAGNVSMTGGTAVTTGTGGSATVKGGAGVGSNQNGGTSNETGGASTGSGTGGAANITGGAGGTTGAGGSPTITSGAGGATSGSSGNIVLALGTTTSGTPGTVQIASHAGFTGAAPAVSACGTSPSIDANANDNSGTVTVGTVAAASCTTTFAKAYATYVHCRVTPQTPLATFAYTYTTSAIVVTATSLLTEVFDYSCDGK